MIVSVNSGAAKIKVGFTSAFISTRTRFVGATQRTSCAERLRPLLRGTATVKILQLTILDGIAMLGLAVGGNVSATLILLKHKMII